MEQEIVDSEGSEQIRKGKTSENMWRQQLPLSW